ncbi:MAG: hypothetical protein R8N23_20925 [Reichenbachiella sp.]|uniref:hypothetical protein n=1 Tax=Reichenbachiella sp. TaxID=2184521 RepID=UPI0029669B68|nr:hypothetical protein [Reichenbachiella sp.]MDW3212347.1 hypothetical protein [Reichenbachiella sp.]
MKKLMLLAVLGIVCSTGAFGQYRPYHKEDLKKYKETSVKSFQIHVTPYTYGRGGKYSPQRFQGLQVISMNRPGGTHDDIYFIDKNGNTQYHTVRPTAPLNTHQNHQGVYDSSSPSGYRYESVGQAVLDGVATMLSGILLD